METVVVQVALLPSSLTQSQKLVPALNPHTLESETSASIARLSAKLALWLGARHVIRVYSLMVLIVCPVPVIASSALPQWFAACVTSTTSQRMEFVRKLVRSKE